MDKQKVFFTILIALILFGTFARFMLLDKDFAAEETDFVNSAKAIMKTGHPVFYRSEQQNNELGLWHPPMYIYSMALAFKIFGIGEIPARSINIILSLLTAILIFLFSLNAFENRGKAIGIISSAFFLVNYYVLSSSAIIDIDILSAFFITSFIFCIFMSCKTNKAIYTVLAAFLFMFSLANRYPVAILVFLSIFLYFLFKKEKRGYAKRLFIIVCLSSLASLLTWSIYSTIIEPGAFFSFIAHNVQLGSEPISNFKVYFFSFLLNIAQFIRLATFPATMLIALSFFYFIKRKELGIRLLLISSGIILLFFFAVPRPAFGYPRYFISAFPALSILVGLLIYESYEKISKIKFNWKENFLLILAFAIALILLVLITPLSTFYEGNGLIRATNLPDFLLNIFCTVPIFFVFFMVREKRAKFAVILLAAIFLAYSLYFDINLIMHDSRIKETGEYIKINTSPNDLIIAPRAVGYYAERRIYVNDNNKPKIDHLSANYLIEYMAKSLENKKMSHEFFWPGGYFGAIYEPVPDTEILKETKYVAAYHSINNDAPNRIIGDFYIYRIE